MAVVEKVSMGTAIVAVLSELDNIYSLKED